MSNGRTGTEPEASSGSLLSPEAMGGFRGGRGYDAERDYILAHLHEWLAHPGFRAVQIEGLTEVEVLFEEDGVRALEYVQAKDHAIDLSAGRGILGEFLGREQCAQGPRYRKYTLACKGLAGAMRSVREAIERYRNATVYLESEKTITLDDITDLLNKHSIQVPAEFLVSKVYFDTDEEWLKSAELRRDLFVTRFVKLPNYRLNIEGAVNAYTEILAQIETSRGRAVQRERIEEIIHARETRLSPPVSLEEEDLASYVKALQSWAVEYQEEIVGWEGVYTPLRAQKLPIHVSPVRGPKSQSEEETPHEVLEIVRTNRKLILVGDPGSGKTTTALKAVYDQARLLESEQSVPVPVLVSLRELTPSIDLVTLIRDSMARYGLHLAHTDVRQLALDSDRLYLVLEGINEIGRAARDAGAEAELARVVHSTPSRVLITTRREGYDPQLFQGLPAIEILPLSLAGIGVFLTEHFADIAEELLDELKSATWQGRYRSTPLLDLSKNPLLLTMVATVFREPPHRLPSNLGDLLTNFTRYIVHRESQKGSQHPPEAREAILEQVAVTMLEAGYQVSLSRSAMEPVIAQALETLKGNHYVSSETTVGDVLSEIDRRVFRFLHSTVDRRAVEWEHHVFQEYYAASWLRRALVGANKQSQRDTLRRAIEPEWLESVRMLSGMLPNEQAIEIIKMLLDIAPLVGAEAFAGASSTVQDRLGPTLVVALERSLHDGDLEVSREAARTLGRMEELAVPTLLTALGHEDHVVRHEAALGLDRVALNSLDDLDLMERRQIYQELRKNERFFENTYLVNDPIIDRWATWLLAEMTRLGSLPDRLLPRAQEALRGALESPDSFVRFVAARASAGSGDRGRAALAELALAQPGNLGESARTAFHKLPPSQQVNILVDIAVGHADQSLQGHAQRYLADYGDAAARAVLKALDQALQSENYAGAGSLISALGFIGGVSAVERLLGLLNPSEPALCTTAAAALGYTGDDRVVTGLVDLLRLQSLPTEQQGVWKGAAKGLMLLGEAALSAVVDFACRELTVAALASTVTSIIANMGTKGVPALRALLKHNTARVRAEAVAQLGWLRPAGVDEEIRSLLDDSDANVRCEAIQALYAVERGQSTLSIIPLLDDHSNGVREEAARILEREKQQEPVLRALAEHLVDYAIAPYAQRALLAAHEAGVSLLLAQLDEPGKKRTARGLLAKIEPAPVEPLRAILANPSDSRRSEVPKILAEILDDESIPLLLPLLQDQSAEMRLTALEILVRFDSPQLTDVIVEAMKDLDAEVRCLATSEAQRYVKLPIASALVSRLRDRNTAVRQAAVSSLEASGHLVFSELVGLATSRASQAQRAALEVLLSLDEKVVPDMLELLRTTRRPKVLSLLNDMFPAIGSAACEELIPLLDSEDTRICRRVSNILLSNRSVSIAAFIRFYQNNPHASQEHVCLLRPLDSDSVRLLARGLSEGDKREVSTSRSVIQHIVNSSPDESEIRAVFETMLTWPDRATRHELFRMLRSTGHLAIQQLEQAISDRQESIREHGIEMLGWLGTPEAIAAVSRMLEPSSSARSRRAACQVLAKARSIASVSSLITAIHDPDSEVRRLAATGLAQSQDSEAIEALMIAAKDSVSSVRLAAVEGLGKIGPLDAFDALVQRVHQDDDPDVASAAARALEGIQHPDAISRLLEITFGDNPTPVRVAAAQALRGKNVDSVQRALPKYMPNLDETSAFHFNLLGHIGEAAIPMLILALKHPSASAKLNGLRTLRDIRASQAQQAVISLTWESLQAVASSEVVVAACRTLGAIGDKRSKSVLDQLQRERWHWRDGQRIVEAAAAAKEQIEKRS